MHAVCLRTVCVQNCWKHCRACLHAYTQTVAQDRQGVLSHGILGWLATLGKHYGYAGSNEHSLAAVHLHSFARHRHVWFAPSMPF